MTNAQLQTQIDGLTADIIKLQNDPNYVANKTRMAAVYIAGNNAPWDSKGNYCWIDSTGQYWCAADSNATFLAVRQAIDQQDAAIAAKQGQIKIIQDQIDKSPETLAAVAAAGQGATAQGLATKQKYIFWTVVVVIIAVAGLIYFKFIHKRIFK